MVMDREALEVGVAVSVEGEAVVDFCGSSRKYSCRVHNLQQNAKHALPVLPYLSLAVLAQPIQHPPYWSLCTLLDRFHVSHHHQQWRIDSPPWRTFQKVSLPLGKFLSYNTTYLTIKLYITDQTEIKGNGTSGLDGAAGDEDFLSRERALLGDDAAQFASTNDHTATATGDGDEDDDLLGGGGSYNDAQTGGDDIGKFESSFPAVDSRNEV